MKLHDVFVTDIHGEYETFANIVHGSLGPVGRLHVLGDVYDRGPAADKVMDLLAELDDVDIVWGNHDVLWMGAALGQRGSIANVVRICARYGNLSVLERTYGMDLTPLRAFARSAYADDPGTAFALKGSPELSSEELEETVKVQKAMAYIQFKVEAQLIDENPSFGLEARKLLHSIDYERGTVEIDGTVHELADTVFPTIDPACPYRLTPEEAQVMEHLVREFTGCERLQRHVRVFLEKGSLYRICGSDLLFHACVPLEADGSFKEVELFGERYCGKALYDAVDALVRSAFEARDAQSRKRGLDMLWYLWLGEGSPLFAKSKMATFELYLVADKAARTEVKNAFYSLWDDEEVLGNVLAEFGLDARRSRILCGHVPVKVKDGQDPVKGGGKLIDLDGGMSKPYQKSSGIGGFALFEDASGSRLATIEAGSAGTVAQWREL